MATGPFKVLFVLLHVFETFLAKYVRAFGEYKMPMGIEMMADEVVLRFLTCFHIATRLSFAT